jgi:hypothetical protein
LGSSSLDAAGIGKADLKSTILALRFSTFSSTNEPSYLKIESQV